MAVLPAEIPTGLVTGQFYFVSADLADANTDPEMETVTGVVRFTSSAPLLRMPSKKATLVPLRFDAKFNANGELVSVADPSVGLRLPRTDSDLINPVGYTWWVEFLLSRASNGQTITIPGFAIRVPAGGTDLTVDMPVQISNGVQIVQGPPGTPSAGDIDAGLERANLPGVVASAVAAQPTVTAAAAAAVDANPKIVQLETVVIPKVLTDAKTYADTKAPRRREALVPLNELRAPGGHWYRNSSIENNPFPGKFITVEVEDFAPFGTAVIQTAKPSSGAALPAYRTYTGTVWTPWVYNTDAAEVAAVKTQLQAFLANPPVTSGSKIVPLAITAAQGPFMEVMARNSVRWVRKWAVAPTRMRIHIANRNPAQGNTGDAVTLNGIWVGKGGADGSVTNASGVLGTKALSSSGAEVVTPWFNSPISDGEYLAISTAWFGADGARVALMQGGGWVSSGSTNAQDATVAGAAWSRKQATPFHVWVEAEVPASTPIICGHGDSITIGTAAVDPVGDSFIARYAHAQGALPVILAEHGSTMAGWISTPRRWTQYPGMNLPAIVDATITTMGQNDLAVAGITVAELQKRHQDMMPLLSVNVGGVIYTGLVTPSSKSADLEVIRKEYNAWLATLPTGARGIFDFAAAVGTPDGEALRPEFSADGLHPNAAGQQAMADVVIARPATPFNLAPSKMKALAALL